MFASCTTVHKVTQLSAKQNGRAMLNEGITQLLYTSSAITITHMLRPVGFLVPNFTVIPEVGFLPHPLLARNIVQKRNVSGRNISSSLRGHVNKNKFQKSKKTLEVGGWVKCPIGNLKKLENIFL